MKKIISIMMILFVSLATQVPIATPAYAASTATKVSFSYICEMIGDDCTLSLQSNKLVFDGELVRPLILPQLSLM